MITASSSSDFNPHHPVSNRDYIEAAFIPEKICGVGATCVVYDMRLDGLRVAVKRLEERYRLNPTYIAAYRKEFEMGRGLKHDALPVYRDFRADSEEVYIVMDFIDGVTLEDFIHSDEGKAYFRDSERIRRFLKELMEVVVYLHRKGIVHCDLKPGNIMLRHSDRGVMLIDLDKAYCDTRDLTHGGTSGFSNVIGNGESPAVGKDFAAIGKIVDTIGEVNPKIPIQKFKKYRKLCDVSGIAESNLFDALWPEKLSGRQWFYIALMSGLAIIGGITFISIRNSDISQKNIQKVVNPDTVVYEPERKIKVKEEGSPVLILPSASQSKTKGIVITGFEEKMADFTIRAMSAKEKVEAGSLSDRELSELIQDLVTVYTDTYARAVSEYMEQYPDKSGLDVQLAVGRVSEQSASSKMFFNLTEAIKDSLNRRHPHP